MTSKTQYDRIMALFEDWKHDPYVFAETHKIPITIEVGRDPKVGALTSIAEHALGSDGGWTVVETFASDPILLVKPAA